MESPLKQLLVSFTVDCDNDFNTNNNTSTTIYVKGNCNKQGFNKILPHYVEQYPVYAVADTTDNM